MSTQLADRMTIGWYGKQEIATAEQIRWVLGPRNLNRKVKEILTQWVRIHANGKKS